MDWIVKPPLVNEFERITHHKLQVTAMSVTIEPPTLKREKA